MTKRRFRPLAVRLGALQLLLVTAGCSGSANQTIQARGTLFIGIDVSGSFEREGRYEDAIDFAARYIDARLRGVGGLEEPRALFVGSIGGERPGQPQAFHPIHDFEGLSIQEIREDLRYWFPPDDRFTDFNAFFERASTEVKRRNLVLAPITIVILSDGVPDMGQDANDPAARYRAIDLDPLEYLARTVTVRLLYPDPEVAVMWEQEVPRSRVRLWTVDNVVMRGWREQLVPAAMQVEAATEPAPELAAEAEDAPSESELLSYPAHQPELWRWIQDNVDFRVRSRVL